MKNISVIKRFKVMEWLYNESLRTNIPLVLVTYDKGITPIDISYLNDLGFIEVVAETIGNTLTAVTIKAKLIEYMENKNDGWLGKI